MKYPSLFLVILLLAVSMLSGCPDAQDTTPRLVGVTLQRSTNSVKDLTTVPTGIYDEARYFSAKQQKYVTLSKGTVANAALIKDLTDSGVVVFYSF